MKAYQVFIGETDKHDRQRYDLVATYLDRQRALDHAKKIADETQLYGDNLVDGDFTPDGRHRTWWAQGWEWVGIARFSEIDITE
jgi:hypothetical protein